MPITVKCQMCGAAIVVPPSRVKRKKFCSRACYAAWLSENQRGLAHPMAGRHHSAESLARMRASGTASAKVGPDNPNWKGSFSSRGYVMVSQPRGKAIPEHRLVAEGMLGRALHSDEIVHHRNGVKHDNRPENLEVLTKRGHRTKHAQEHAELRVLRAAAEKCSCGAFPKPG